MGISRYLAMTAAEMAAFSLPQTVLPAYMACHFSPYGTGLSNIPAKLPKGSMLMVNDRTPFHGHDPQQILLQLQEAYEQLRFESVLLDFERPETAAYNELCRVLMEQLSCPVGISAPYTEGLDCPVFLPPTPMDQPLSDYISPWKGREIWLDIAPEAACITVTERGSSYSPVPFSPPPENAFTDEDLHCKYRTETGEALICFHLWRDPQQVEQLIDHAQSLGITKCIGLFQELYCGK